MRTVVLDTNAYSRLLAGDEKVAAALNEADRIFLPIFVIAELLLGFKNGRKEAWNREILQKFEAKETVARFYPTDETAEIFSELFWSLRQAGTPIPTHDLWIGAIAVETGSVLISYDKHFLRLPQVRRWRELR